MCQVWSCLGPILQRVTSCSLDRTIRRMQCEKEWCALKMQATLPSLTRPCSMRDFQRFGCKGTASTSHLLGIGLIERDSVGRSFVCFGWFACVRWGMGSARGLTTTPQHHQQTATYRRTRTHTRERARTHAYTCIHTHTHTSTRARTPRANIL